MGRRELKKMTEVQEFGELITLIRALYHLKQEDLAKIMGLSRLTIIKMEKGEVLPDFDELVKLIFHIGFNGYRTDHILQVYSNASIKSIGVEEYYKHIPLKVVLNSAKMLWDENCTDTWKFMVDSSCLFLKITDEAMNPLVSSGDTIVLNPNTTIKNHDIVLIYSKMANSGYIRKVRKRPEQPIIFYDVTQLSPPINHSDDVKILGRVMHMIRTFKRPGDSDKE